ncbi:MAG: tetratricopeptide repeat protein, partial [Ktedonobacteraceae bacterium]|nr:tetratricopeptide repeat protein [Ktedonobacteraceae bacterium]
LTPALSISESLHGLEHVDTARNALTLAYLYEKQGRYEEAKSLYMRACAIAERILGENHPSTRTFRANYAILLRAMGHEDEASALEQGKEPL